MQIDGMETIGRMVRERRLATGMNRQALAASIGVGARFLYDLENGKDGCAMGLVLKVMTHLGIQIHAGDPPAPAFVDDGSGLDLPEHGGTFAMDIEEDGGFRL